MDVEQDTAYEYDESFYFRLALDLLNVLTVLSIAADIFVSFVIVKYQELRKDATNVLLLHINIVEVLFLLTTTIAMRIFVVSGIDVTSTVHCVICEVDTALMLCVFLLLILLTTDWYLKTYSVSKYPGFRRVCNFCAAAIYLLTTAVAYGTSRHCSCSNNFCAFILQVAMVFSSVMIVFVNVVHRVKARRSTERAPDNIGLAIANIFMLAWTPVYLTALFAIFADYPDILEVFTIAAVSTCLAIPIFNLFYLYRCDAFNSFLTRAVRCHCNDDETLGQTSVALNNSPADNSRIRISQHFVNISPN